MTALGYKMKKHLKQQELVDDFRLFNAGSESISRFSPISQAQMLSLLLSFCHKEWRMFSAVDDCYSVQSPELNLQASNAIVWL